MELITNHLFMLLKLLLRPLKGLNFVTFLLCILFCLAICGPCAKWQPHMSDFDGVMGQLGCQEFGSNGGDSYHIGALDIIVDDSAEPKSIITTVCANFELFCFPSILSTFSGDENTKELEESGPHDKLESNSTWLSERGSFWLLDGRIVSCSLKSGNVHPNDIKDSGKCSSCEGNVLKHHKQNNVHDKNSNIIEPDLLTNSSPLHVEISPPFLDWGHNYLFSPSVATLTVTNKHNHRNLSIYELFSTDMQFYTCNFSKISLGPSEAVSISVVFLPQQLGSLSAHLVMQTGSGGVLISVRGVSMESLYGIKAPVQLDISSAVKWSENLSLHNPFDDILFVKEVTALISISSGNTSRSIEAICKIDGSPSLHEFSASLSSGELLDVKRDGLDLLLLGIKPHNSWEIGPRNTESIIALDILSDTKTKIIGTFRLKLHSGSHDHIDSIFIPVDIEMPGKTVYTGITSSVSLSLESLGLCDSGETMAIAIFLRNEGEYLLSISKVSEDTETVKSFNIKYMEGLLLFPGSITQIAVVTYTRSPIDSVEHPHGVPELDPKCKLLVLTNDSGGSNILIPCQHVFDACSLQPFPYSELKRHSRPSYNIKLNAMKIAEADESILANWRSQGTISGMSVLDDNEVMFSTIQVGTLSSKWISVKNPSDQPILMQLILNSGVVVENCRTLDSFQKSRYLVSDDFTVSAQYGFSIPETAVTEAYVHPFSSASLGPVMFHPSSLCKWRSSALIRNNLSGVEWLPIQGFGGSFSLVLFEGSKPIENLEFRFDIPISLDFPSPKLHHMIDTHDAYSHTLSKELYAKNTGNLPLDVRKIVVSGVDCGVDGFMVHSCKSFSLKPGESKKLLVSYRTDFFTAEVHRDLGLAFATGSVIIPLKVNLSYHAISSCRKSLFWILLKKVSVVVLIAASVTFVGFSIILPQVLALGSQDYLFKTENATITRIDKPERTGKLAAILRSVGKDEASKQNFVGRYSDHLCVVQRHVQSGTQLVANSLKFVEASCVIEETPSAGNLTVKVGKEKGKRRRKKRAAGTNVGLLTGLLEGTSSQSGNSTPSSPLSPDINHPPETRNLFAGSLHQNHQKDQPSRAQKKGTQRDFSVSSTSFRPQTPPPTASPRKPVLLQSATFPSTTHRGPAMLSPAPAPISASASSSLHARAPGPNLFKEKPVEVEKKEIYKDEFTYDIWGNHFYGFHLGAKANDFSTIRFNPSGDESNSFFAREPQVLMQKNPVNYVVPDSKMSHPAGNRIYPNEIIK